jgi:hypothetical protein
MPKTLVRPPERKLPLSEMTSAGLKSYHRALLGYLRHCAKHAPWYEEQRACLAEVMAEERERRLADSASGSTFTVARIHLLPH